MGIQKMFGGAGANPASLSPAVRNAASGVSAGQRTVGSAERQGMNSANALLKHLAATSEKPHKPVQRSGAYPPAKGI